MFVLVFLYCYVDSFLWRGIHCLVEFQNHRHFQGIPQGYGVITSKKVARSKIPVLLRVDGFGRTDKKSFAKVKDNKLYRFFPRSEKNNNNRQISVNICVGIYDVLC